MSRIIIALSLLLTPLYALAADGDAPPAGTWKLSIYQQGNLHMLWIVELKSKDGKWTGTMVATPKDISKGKVEDVEVAGDVLRFKLKIEDQVLGFEGKVPK
jgi:hypothetical protein